ncbi:MAG: ATP-binding protein [Myxococcales bacterium]
MIRPQRRNARGKRPDKQPKARRRPVSPFDALPHRLALATGEEGALAALMETLNRTLAGCASAVRLIDPATGRLVAARADRALLPDARARLALDRAALERANLDSAALPPQVAVARRRQPVFSVGARGSSIPLVAAEGLVGILDVETTGRRPLPARALEELWRVAPQTAAALRNAQLIAELRQVRRHLEDLIERANALILVTDGGRRVRFFNDAFCAFSGRRREDVLGRDLVELVPPEDRLRLVRAIAGSLRGQPIDHLEIGFLTADGARAPVSVNTATLVSRDGAIEGVIAIGEDLRRFRELERRFIQAEKLSSLGQLAAGVVHELNNPLTSITLSAEALRSRFAVAQEVVDADREKVDRILEASQRIQRFTRDLLTYARPAPAEATSIDVGDLVRTALQFCEHLVRESGAELQVDVAPSLPAVQGVRSNLLQVLVNLVTNACHALDGPGVVEVSAGMGSDSVLLRVRDEGKGIPRADLPRVFEPFFTTKLGGTGLGLSIVQGIVASHGGTVEVASEPGRGTAFTVRLPAAPAHN